MQLDYSGSGIIFYDKNEYQCNLYLNRNEGGILIKISVSNALASFLEFPFNIKLLSGELSTGYKFLLVNCSRNKMEGLISEDISVFTYSAQYMFEGVGGKEYNSIELYRVIFELSDIIEWGDISGYSIGKDHEILENDNCEKLILENENYNIKYIVNNSMLPVVSSQLLKENIILEQSGNIEITFKNEVSILEFDQIFNKIKRLIELSTLRYIHLTKVIGWTKNIYDVYGQEKIERAIDIVSSNISENINKNNKIRKWKWITLPELIENNSFENYFLKYELLEPIVELYLEIIESKEMSVIRIFLNVVQALETYHSRFKTNNIQDFKNRIDTVILKDRPKDFIEKDKEFLMANSKKFITLESRIADLLIADFNIRFDTGDIKYLDFPNVIAKTRNYYIHYDEGIKESGRVLTEDELSIYNHTMIYILEYYLLLELGFSNFRQIKQKLNERWGTISDTLSMIRHSKKIESRKLDENSINKNKDSTN